MTTPLTEPTILVTGATDGIGKGTARELARRGVRVLLHGRSAERVAAARDEIAAATGNDRLETYVADFASLREVHRLAGRAGFRPARPSACPHQQRRHRRRAARQTARGQRQWLRAPPCK